MLQFPLESGMKTEMLENFVKSHQEFQNTALRVDMSTILKNETSLFAFMNFLKEKQAIDQLHFCLAVGEFFFIFFFVVKDSNVFFCNYPFQRNSTRKL